MSNDDDTAAESGVHLSEDWLATLVGLTLIVLILTGVITKGVLQ